MGDQHLDYAAAAARRASSDHTTLSVVTGPKTRLGAALIERAASAGRPVLAIARDERDADALEDSAATVVTTGEAALSLPGSGAVRIYVCALGPIHAGLPDGAADAAGVAADLATIGGLLDSAMGREVHVVLVSTVIALAPSESQRYYGGQKNIVEDQLRALIGKHPAGARLSVLYPGRLLAAADRNRPWHRGYTTFDHLAALVERAGERSAYARVVGLDARLWLLLRTVSLGIHVISGRVRLAPVPMGTGPGREPGFVEREEEV